jgi:hypothetical protein
MTKSESGEYNVPASDRIRCSTCRARQVGTVACPDCAGRGWLTRQEFTQMHATRMGRPPEYR